MTKWYRYERVLPRFLRTARRIHTVDQPVDADQAKIWAVLADPATWSKWFPGVAEAVELPDPRTGSTQSIQLGTRLFANVKFSKFESEIIEWDPPHKLAWCVRRSTFPWGHAQIDEFEVFEAEDGNHVRWTTAVSPRFGVRLPMVIWHSLRKRVWRKAAAALQTAANAPSEVVTAAASQPGETIDLSDQASARAGL